MGYLRRVVDIKTEGSKVTLQTEQAYLTDLFVNIDFKLNTSIIDSDQIVSSKSSSKGKSEALTDKGGFIHPCEIINYDDHGKPQILYSYDSKSSDATFNIINFLQDFSKTDLYGNVDSDVHLYISEGHASLKSDAVLEFDFNSKGEYDEDTQVEKGDLNEFSFYLDSKAEFQTKLALDLKKAFEKSDKKKLTDFRKKTLKFMVGVVPVWIRFDCNVYGAYDFNADASLHADWGFESNESLKVGDNYNGQTNTHTPIKEFTPQNAVYPLNISGEANLNARFEIYPRVEIMLYSLFGPYAEIVPFVDGNYNAAFHNQTTQNGSETFLAWNSRVNLGLDLRIGAKLDFIGKKFDQEFGPETINCFELPLWQCPDKINITSTIPTESSLNSIIPLNFQIKDNLNNTVKLCPLYISGDGSFSKNIILSDLQGNISVNWILNVSTGGLKKFSAKIFGANGDVINELIGQVNIPQILPTGKISGIVRDASSSSPLSGVTANVYLLSNLTATGITQGDGGYELSVPGNTGYKVIFSKPGYLNAEYQNVNVAINSNTFLEPVLQINQLYSGNGNISGTIINALDGSGIASVTLQLRSGINVTSGTLISSTITSNAGTYTFNNIPAGNYTIEASSTTFNTTFFTVICLGGQTTENQDATMSPILNMGEIRIVLTWGELPYDLDSHLTGPLPDGSRFHMYFIYSGVGYSPWPETVTLDRDDIDSYGPETTTLFQQIDGIYRFSVHDYTNKNSTSSTALSNSGAQVKVYKSTGLIATFNIPPNIGGTLWTVFEMSNNVISPINQMSYVSDQSQVSKGGYKNPDSELFRNLPKK
jgi:hypothetical protein